MAREKCSVVIAGQFMGASNNALSRIGSAGVIDMVMGTAYELRIPPPFEDAVKSMEREIMRLICSRRPGCARIALIRHSAARTDCGHGFFGSHRICAAIGSATECAVRG